MQYAQKAFKEVRLSTKVLKMATKGKQIKVTLELDGNKVDELFGDLKFESTLAAQHEDKPPPTFDDDDDADLIIIEDDEEEGAPTPPPQDGPWGIDGPDGESAPAG